MKQKLNLRVIAELKPKEQEQFQRWSHYHLCKYHPRPEQIRAIQEQDEDDDSRSTS